MKDGVESSTELVTKKEILQGRRKQCWLFGATTEQMHGRAGYSWCTLGSSAFLLGVLVEGWERQVFGWLQPVFSAVFRAGPVDDVEGVDWARKRGAVLLTLVHHAAVDDDARTFVHWDWYKSLIAVVVRSNIDHPEQGSVWFRIAHVPPGQWHCLV